LTNPADAATQLGETRAMYLYMALVIAYVFVAPRWVDMPTSSDSLQITVWVVPSLIENVLAIAIVGLLLGSCPR
jgi:hypothetical protein